MRPLQRKGDAPDEKITVPGIVPDSACVKIDRLDFRRTRRILLDAALKNVE